MSVDATLEDAFTILLMKAQRPAQEPAVRPATVNFEFAGGGLPIVPTNADPVKAAIPFPSRIVWARLCAGDGAGNPVAVSATVDVRLTSFETFGASSALYGSGAVPSLQSESSRDCDLSGWQVNLLTGDWLIARLLTYTGTATWVALEIQLRPTDVPIGVAGVVDNSGDQLVDNDGNRIVLRN